LVGIRGVIVAAPAGFLGACFGCVCFFVFGTLIAIPGLLLLTRFGGWLMEADHAG